jgi:hypothetical protein
LDTPGGRFYAEWDEQAPVTREGQLIFFFQFLEAGGRWEEFLRECPLSYTGSRGSGALNVMGKVLLSVLAGHWRPAGSASWVTSGRCRCWRNKPGCHE